MCVIVRTKRPSEDTLEKYWPHTGTAHKRYLVSVLLLPG